MSVSNQPRYLLLKIDPRPRRRAERLTDHLIRAGFQVISVSTISEAERIIRRVVPTLILVFDDIKRNVDAMIWITQQQSGASAQLAMTPLLILAHPSRQRLLRFQELPDRVRVLPHNLSPEELLQHIHRMLSVWLF
ncbi:MAG: hypothetical protein CUN55_10545 [Phototrophicales bacterium]|nr:MAG: hypothetical protein CUN55_10545 [Phototrophicales bacterium]